MNPDKLTEKIQATVAETADLLTNAGWIQDIETTGTSVAIKYTDHGEDRMKLLHDIFFDEIQPRMTPDNFLGLLALLSARPKEEDNS